MGCRVDDLVHSGRVDLVDMPLIGVDLGLGFIKIGSFCSPLLFYKERGIGNTVGDAKQDCLQILYLSSKIPQQIHIYRQAYLCKLNRFGTPFRCK